MRELERIEVKKRGCKCCEDVVYKWTMKRYGTCTTTHRVKAPCCPYDECPYKELDKYDTYGEYLDNTEPFQFIMPRGEENL